MKKWIISALIMLAATVSCQQLQYPARSGDMSLNGLKCFVYYDLSNAYARQELNLLSGTYNKERGLISYTFPSGEKYTEETLKHCRIEATIPPTATLELLDEAGAPLGHGFEGFYNLAGTTLYFKITAADGTSQSFQLTCKQSH